MEHNKPTLMNISTETEIVEHLHKINGKTFKHNIHYIGENFLLVSSFTPYGFNTLTEYGFHFFENEDNKQDIIDRISWKTNPIDLCDTENTGQMHHIEDVMTLFCMETSNTLKYNNNNNNGKQDYMGYLKLMYECISK